MFTPGASTARGAAGRTAGAHFASSGAGRAVDNGCVEVRTATTGPTRTAWARAGCSPDRVLVSLAAARSAQVVVYGPIRGRARFVPYQGPEPVLDFLKRVGGLPPGSKLNQVYVVRPNVAAAARPQVFKVDVPAVLVDGDQRTNVVLRGDDEVYVGETRRSSLSRLLPDRVGTAYRRVTGLLPDEWWPFTKSTKGPGSGRSGVPE